MIREAIGKENVVALGRVVFTTREHVIAIEPRGKGLLHHAALSLRDSRARGLFWRYTR